MPKVRTKSNVRPPTRRKPARCLDRKRKHSTGDDSAGIDQFPPKDTGVTAGGVSTGMGTVPVPVPTTTTRRRPPEYTNPQRIAAQNLYDAIGGDEHVLIALDHNIHPKARELADGIRSSVRPRSFLTVLRSTGLQLSDFAEMFYNYESAHAFVIAVRSMTEVIAGIVTRAKDSFAPCTECETYGKVLGRRDENGMRTPTTEDCWKCYGIGWVNKSASAEDVELFLEIVRMRKNQTVIDMSRKTTNQMYQPNFYGAGGGGLGALGGQPGTVPEIAQIIRRADEQVLLPGRVQGQVVDPVPVEVQPDGQPMPEEAVLVE